MENHHLSTEILVFFDFGIIKGIYLLSTALIVHMLMVLRLYKLRDKFSFLMLYHYSFSGFKVHDYSALAVISKWHEPRTTTLITLLARKVALFVDVDARI